MTQTLDRSRFVRGLLGWLFFVAVVVLLFVWLKQANPNTAIIPLSTFYSQVKSQNLAKVAIDGDEVSGKFIVPVTMDGVSISFFRANLPAGGNWSFSQWLMDTSPNTQVQAAPNNTFLNNILLPFTPWLFIFLFIWFFVFRQLRNRPSPVQQPVPVIVVNPEVK